MIKIVFVTYIQFDKQIFNGIYVERYKITLFAELQKMKIHNDLLVEHSTR